MEKYEGPKRKYRNFESCKALLSTDYIIERVGSGFVLSIEDYFNLKSDEFSKITNQEDKEWFEKAKEELIKEHGKH